MKNFGRSLFVLILLVTLCLHAQESLRLGRDRAAKTAFRQLNFFTAGRGMNLSPDLITAYDFFGRSDLVRQQMKTRWGFLFDENQLVGLSETTYKKMKIGVIGCAACHTGKAAGEVIFGLGNKNIDVVSLATDVNRVEKIWKAVKGPESFKSPDYREVESSALDFSNYLANRQIGNLSQGLVPVSFIRGWFFRMQNLPIPLSMPRGQVKVPVLWGYELKRKIGQFCDGYGNGEKAGWAVAVELAAGQKHEIVRDYYASVEKAELLFNDFLPPKYPFGVDENRATSGKFIFDQTCAHCHGSYVKDESGLPVFAAPKFIPLNIVDTDPDRVDGNTEAFADLVAKNPLSDFIQKTDLGRGYFAPRLDGIWSRFPYLHNGSVPNLRALLMKPSERPKYFSLIDAGERSRFDESALGLTVSINADLERRALLGERNIYSIARVGHSNQGHDFYTGLSETAKSALIEYLKTL